MRVCNNFKPLPRGWDQPGKTHAMPHVTLPSHPLDLKFLNIADQVCIKTHIYTE